MKLHQFVAARSGELINALITYHIIKHVGRINQFIDDPVKLFTSTDQSEFSRQLVNLIHLPVIFQDNHLNFQSINGSYVDSISIIGVGGTGSWLVEFLNYRKNNSTKISIYDHDVVEEKNIARQNFQSDSIGDLKVLSVIKNQSVNFHKINETFAVIATEFVAKRMESIASIPVIIGCVDSIESREYILTELEKLDDWVYIDSGNEDLYGQVFVNIKRNGVAEFAPPFLEMLNSPKQAAGRISCADVEQSYMINQLAAAVITTVLQLKVNGPAAYYFNALSINFAAGFKFWKITIYF